jgi:hypothetical protein
MALMNRHLSSEQETVHGAIVDTTYISASLGAKWRARES